MALISIKNLVAPVSNSVHLMFIFLIVVAFGVWRWSGGEVNFTVSSKSSNAHISDQEAPSIVRERAVKQEKVQDTKTTTRTLTVTDEAADDLLGSILNKPSKSTKSPSRDADPDAQRRPRSGNSLEDIERSLGINKK